VQVLDVQNSVVDPNPVGSGPSWSDPDVHQTRIRIWIKLTYSKKQSASNNCTVQYICILYSMYVQVLEVFGTVVIFRSIGLLVCLGQLIDKLANTFFFK
jgi:hypothetical protein